MQQTVPPGGTVYERLWLLIEGLLLGLLFEVGHCLCPRLCLCLRFHLRPNSFRLSDDYWLIALQLSERVSKVECIVKIAVSFHPTRPIQGGLEGEPECGGHDTALVTRHILNFSSGEAQKECVRNMCLTDTEGRWVEIAFLH